MSELIKIEVTSDGVAIATRNLKDLTTQLDKTGESINFVRRSSNLMNASMRRVATSAEATEKSNRALTGSITGIRRASAEATKEMIDLSKGARRASGNVGQLDRRLRRIGKTTKTVARGTKKAAKSMSFLRKAALAFVAIRFGRSLAGLGIHLAETADKFTELGTRVNVVTTSQIEADIIQRRLLKSSQDSKASLEGTASVYSRVALSVKNLGVSQNQTIQFTETLNKAILVGGTSAIEAKNAMIQLSQGMASNRLSGDELRSVLEQMPIVADLIAKKMTKIKGFQVLRGDIKALAKAGELTAKTVFDAVLEGTSDMDSQFKQVNMTMGQGAQILTDGWMIAIGTINKELGTGEGIANLLSDVGKNLADVGYELATIAGIVVGFEPLGDKFKVDTSQLNELAFILARLKDTFMGPVSGFIDIARTVMVATDDSLSDKQKFDQQHALAKSIKDSFSGSLMGNEGPNERAVMDRVRTGGVRLTNNRLPGIGENDDPSLNSSLEAVNPRFQGLDVKSKQVKSGLVSKSKKKGRKKKELLTLEQILQKLERKNELDLESELIRKRGVRLDKVSLQIAKSKLSLIKNKKDRDNAMQEGESRAKFLIEDNLLIEWKKKEMKKINNLKDQEIKKADKLLSKEIERIDAKRKERDEELNVRSSKLEGPDFNTAFAEQDQSYIESTRTFSQEMANIWGSGGTISQGVSEFGSKMTDVLIQGAIFERSWKDISADIGKIARQFLSDVLGNMVKVAAQQAINSLTRDAAIKRQSTLISVERAKNDSAATLSRSASVTSHATAMAQIVAQTKAAAVAVSATSFSQASSASGDSSGSGAALSGGIQGAATNIGVGIASDVIVGALSGRKNGGYTGDAGTNAVVGFHHGKEYVMPAEQTKKNRGALDAMRAGGSGQSKAAPMTVNVVNNAAGIEFDTNQIDESTIEVIARRVVAQDAPRVIAGDLQNPSSRTSRAVTRNTHTKYKKGG